MKKKKVGTGLPPALRAILKLGGSAEVAHLLGEGVTKDAIDQWRASMRIPVGHILKVSKLSEIPVEEFLGYEEELLRARTARRGNGTPSKQGADARRTRAPRAKT